MVLALSQVLFDRPRARRSAAPSRTFKTPDEVRDAITKSANYKFDCTPASEAGYQAIFSTSTQSTALVVTPRRLYIVLDDLRNRRPKVIRSYSKSRLLGPKDHFLQTLTFKERPGKKSGLLDFGDESRKGILLMPHLVGSDPAGKVREFVKQTMT